MNGKLSDALGTNGEAASGVCANGEGEVDSDIGSREREKVEAAALGDRGVAIC